MANFIIGMLLLAVIIKAFFFSRRRKLNFIGCRVLERKIDAVIDGLDEAQKSRLHEIIGYISAGGFEPALALEFLSGDFDKLFVYVNKNYSLYLEIYCGNDRLAYNIMTQYPDGSILITPSEGLALPEENDWLAINDRVCGLPDYNDENYATGAIEVLKKMLGIHFEKVMAINVRKKSPYYVSIYDYADCKNYIFRLQEAENAGKNE